MKRIFLLLVLLVGCADRSPPAYKAGELVQLNCGGPTMSVRYDSYNTGLVWCDWIDNLGQPQTGTFKQTSIKRVP